MLLCLPVPLFILRNAFDYVQSSKSLREFQVAWDEYSVWVFSELPFSK